MRIGKQMIRNPVLITAIFLMMTTGAAFAQAAGEATYKANCLKCHGAEGMAESAIGRITHTRPITDPEVRKLTAEQMFDYTKNGKDKMMPFKNKLSDAEIKASVEYFRSLMK